MPPSRGRLGTAWWIAVAFRAVSMLCTEVSAPESCTDDPAYFERWYDCEDWRGYFCALSGPAYGLDEASVRMLLRSCPLSCADAVVSSACEHSAPYLPQRYSRRAGAANQQVHWDPSSESSVPFSIPFVMSAHDGHLWIKPEFVVDEPGAPTSWQRFRIKGTNWAGFQAGGCVQELWKRDVSDYIAFLRENRFNAVRLPLSAALIVAEPPYRIPNDYICGAKYFNWKTLDILDDVLSQLKVAGIFVMLDMHTTSHPEGNQGHPTDTIWPSTPKTIYDAWKVLTDRYCSMPNVVMADVFNEPYDSEPRSNRTCRESPCVLLTGAHVSSWVPPTRGSVVGCMERLCSEGREPDPFELPSLAHRCRGCRKFW